jgi:hypothetical protein
LEENQNEKNENIFVALTLYFSSASRFRGWPERENIGWRAGGFIGDRRILLSRKERRQTKLLDGPLTNVVYSIFFYG